MSEQTDTMVERMNRAIAVELERAGIYAININPGLAALPAMREPSPKMFAAGIAANDKYAMEVAPCSGFRALSAWEAMIDAAISEAS